MDGFPKIEVVAVQGPREKGFNYGQPLPPPYGPDYDEGTVRLAALRSISAQASRRVWELEMATRAVRIAETVEERQKAQAAVRALLAADHEAINYAVTPQGVVVDIAIEVEISRFEDDGGPALGDD